MVVEISPRLNVKVTKFGIFSATVLGAYLEEAVCFHLQWLMKEILEE